ncbi:MAG: hypothetical protein J2P45_20770, partial [Candidatus Dormibacteraeota bacterium]|nr:hypothetical protein [Candidatus Dormibacteraeota bacterium]
KPAAVPRSPARPAGTGESRRRGVGRIELRSLGDPALRSLTLQEEGVTIVVINTQHPLFIERRGDVWYQLETAAREIYAPLEGTTVGEYERHVNQVMLLALGIRRRRRAPRGEQTRLALGSSSTK